MYKDQTEMARVLGSTRGHQCWCGGDGQATGYVHMKTFRPYSCREPQCERLESLYQKLPKAEDHHDVVFGDYY